MTCLVTGAASGIGRSTAQVFAAEGAALVLTDIDAEGLAETVADLGESVAGHHTTDLSSEERVGELFERAVSPQGKLDGLVCCHGLNDFEDGLLEGHSTEVFDRTMATNLRSCYLLARESIPFMKAAGGGSIVLISSSASLVTPASTVAYTASKGAVNSMGKAISGQYAADGIRCNVICPGLIRTPMFERFAAKRGIAPPTNHMERIGDPRDIGHAAAFLCSRDSAYITATIQAVDGGLTQH
jgi:NAD(P)-dependent dehydrogenase (short-subunit alcohol dehydrogenase family)